jgi:hypothetical protein
MYDYGRGLEKIADIKLARALLDKTNDMNTAIGVQVLVPVTLFALLPQSAAAALVISLLVFGALYAAKDKLLMSADNLLE